MDPKTILQRSQERTRCSEWSLFNGVRGNPGSPMDLVGISRAWLHTQDTNCCSFSTSLNTNGQDQLGNAVLHEQIYRAKGLEKWRRNLHRNGDMSPEYLSKIDRSLDRLSWSLYTLHSLTLMSLERTELTKVPTRPKPPSDHHKKNHDGWMPYPQPHNPVTFHHNCHYLAFVSLIEEAARVEALFVKQARDDSSMIMAELENVCRQLGDWPHTLPECLKMHEKSMPHVIALQ